MTSVLTEEYQHLFTKYRNQCEILGIRSPSDIRGESIERPGYKLSPEKINEKNERYRTLQILSTNKLLFEDFEYLEMFQGFTALILGKYQFLDPLLSRDIGCNLHCFSSHLKWIVINYHVLSFHEDFKQIAPFLEGLEFEGALNVSGLKYDFPLLKKFKVGIRSNSSSTDLELLQTAPKLENLKIIQLLQSIPRLFDNLTFLGFVDCDLSRIPLSHWASLRKIETLFANNCSGLPAFSSFVPQLTTLKVLEFTNDGYGTLARHVSFAGQTLLVTSALKDIRLFQLSESHVENLVLDAAGNVSFALEKIYISNPDVRQRPNFTNLSILNNTLMPTGFMAIDLVEVEISGEFFPWALLSMRRLDRYSGGTKIDMREYQPTYEQEIDNIRYDILWTRVPCSDTIHDVAIPRRNELFKRLKATNRNLRFILWPGQEIGEEEFTFYLSEEELRFYHYARVPSIANYASPPVDETCSICTDSFDESGKSGEVSRVLMAYCYLGGFSDSFLNAMIRSAKWTVEDIIYARSFIDEPPNIQICVSCDITEQDVLRQKPELQNNPSAIETEIHIHDKHYFHPTCLSQWVLANNTCPIARTTFLRD